MLSKRIIFSIFFVIFFISEVRAIFKMKRGECQNFDKKFLNISTCHLKPINRNVGEFSFKGLLLEKLVSCKIRAELLKKYTVYRNFLFNFTVDACDFMRNRKKYPVFTVIYDLFGPFSNINHTCPYEGFLIVDKFSTKHESFPLPLPSGEYRLDLHWYINGVYRLIVQVWFVFEELNKRSGVRTYEILQ